jgi:pilus assembly protein CpaB
VRRTIIFITLAAVGSLLAAVVVFSALKKREADVQRAMAHTAQVVVAAHAIPLGAKLQVGDLKLARWSRDSVPEGSFSDPEAAVGAFAKGQFAPNEPILSDRLLVGNKTAGVMPFLIPPGMRAISVAVDEVADISGFVQPHSRVDVLLAISGSGPGESSFSRTVAQNIEVIAVAQQMEKVKDEPEVVKVVTLLVTPPEAERLTLATREGTIRLAMRSYGDSKVVATSGIGIDEMMRNAHADVPLMEKQPLAAIPALRRVARRAHGPTPFNLEILRDGKSTEAYSFINSAIVGHTGGGDRASSPAPPPQPSFSDDGAQPQSPPSYGNSASVVGAPSPAVAAVMRKEAGSHAPEPASIPPLSASDGSITNSSLALHPGDVGYMPAPKTFELAPK